MPRRSDQGFFPFGLSEEEAGHHHLLHQGGAPIHEPFPALYKSRCFDNPHATVTQASNRIGSNSLMLAMASPIKEKR